MSKNIINIGIPSKGRLRKDILKIFKKNKLNLISERGERYLLGSIKQLKNLFHHAQKLDVIYFFWIFLKYLFEVYLYLEYQY